jgi:CRP-like cAMP-binding protein
MSGRQMADLVSTSFGLKAGSPLRPVGNGAAAAALLRHLGRFAALTPAETDEVCDLVLQRKRWRSGTTLAPEGRATRAHFVLSGWACSQRVLRDGRRQIFDLIVPGEGYGFGPTGQGRGRQTIVALTSTETVDASVFLDGAHEAPSGGLWRAMLAMVVDEDLRRSDHMVRLGRLTAYEKTAHFILEMQRRTGFAHAPSFSLPLTQEIVADTLGLSVVHLNRVLRQLRAEGIVTIRAGVATVRDQKALAAAAVLPLAADEPLLAG